MATPERRARCNASKPNGKKAAHQKTAVRLANWRPEDEAAVTPVNTVTETVVVLPSGMLNGVTLQVELTGIPEQVNVTVPETFDAELSSKGKTAFWPFVMVTLVIPLVVRVKSTPDPVSESV